MISFSSLHQIPPLGSLEAVYLQKLMNMDVTFQVTLRALQKRLPHLLNARLKNGSGLQMSNLLRSYFLEYFNRYVNLGPSSFPTSFNVVESFMWFDRENRLFDLRNEKEHLLALDDYFRWYAKGEIPKDQSILEDIIAEGVIYSYDMINDIGGLRIRGQSEQVFAGVSLVRHEHELSCLLLAGEKPPLTSDEEVGAMLKEADLAKNPTGVAPDPDLSAKDRYLEGFPEFAKVILMTRFDVRAKSHDVRYVNLDLGPSFTVFTDDFAVLGDLPDCERRRLEQMALGGLPRYDDLFAALSAMIYLPAFFAAFPNWIQELKVSTALGTMREEKKVQDIVREIGISHCIWDRDVRCFRTTYDNGCNSLQQIDPPEMTFKSDGYWRTIGPHEIGEGKNGDKIFGRTWVSRHETWSARSPQSFMLQKSHTKELPGEDPGIVYVQRSPALEVDLYKVGLTRRSAEVRAEELSSTTGVPLPFGILATWRVGDCGRVEREVHQRLATFRINPRREFFRAELSHIIQVVESVIRELSPHG